MKYFYADKAELFWFKNCIIPDAAYLLFFEQKYKKLSNIFEGNSILSV